MISFIVPTAGARDTLAETLTSIETLPGDEILVVGPVTVTDPRVRVIPTAPVHDWGATERTIGMRLATQPWLAFMDDDDVYAPNHRAFMSCAIADAPDRPILFRMTYPDGHLIWGSPEVSIGNVSTQMMLMPNDPKRLGIWQSGRRECDFDFLETMGWPRAALAWRPEVICHRSDEKSRL